MMKVLGISIAQPRSVAHNGKTIRTGIFKEPISGPVRVGHLGVDGDGQADLRVHGGPDMAVYAYPVEHYAYWQDALGRRPFPHGQFGENLTIEGLTEDAAYIGDILRIGGVLAQISQPRVPCFKLALKMEEGPKFVKRFLAAGRLGFYLRVLEEGQIEAGDPIEVTEHASASVSVAKCIEVFRKARPSTDALHDVIGSIGLSQEWRQEFERRLVTATSGCRLRPGRY